MCDERQFGWEPRWLQHYLVTETGTTLKHSTETVFAPVGFWAFSRADNISGGNYKEITLQYGHICLDRFNMLKEKDDDDHSPLAHNIVVESLCANLRWKKDDKRKKNLNFDAAFLQRWALSKHTPYHVHVGLESVKVGKILNQLKLLYSEKQFSFQNPLTALIQPFATPHFQLVFAKLGFLPSSYPIPRKSGGRDHQDSKKLWLPTHLWLSGNVRRILSNDWSGSYCILQFELSSGENKTLQELVPVWPCNLLRLLLLHYYTSIILGVCPCLSSKSFSTTTWYTLQSSHLMDWLDWWSRALLLLINNASLQHSAVNEATTSTAFPHLANDSKPGIHNWVKEIKWD